MLSFDNDYREVSVTLSVSYFSIYLARPTGNRREPLELSHHDVYLEGTGSSRSVSDGSEDGQSGNGPNPKPEHQKLPIQRSESAEPLTPRTDRKPYFKSCKSVPGHLPLKSGTCSLGYCKQL